MLVETNKIIVNERIRKDFGNIEELANDIKENGLINPPVVTPAFELIAGERRLRALKYLGYNQIEVRVMTVQDALHQLKLEISENENRKDFSFSEKMKWAEELKKEYSKIAKENQKSTQFGNGGVNVDTSDKGRVRDKIADDLDISTGTLAKAQYIYNNAPEELIKDLDAEKLSINKAYNTLKAQLKAEKDKAVQLEQKLKQEQSKPPRVEIREIEVDKTDYSVVRKAQQLENILNEKDAQVVKLKKKLELMENKAEAYKQDSYEYKKMKEDIAYLTQQKDDLGRQIQAITDISSLVVEVDNLIKNKLAPVRYSKSIREANKDEIVIANLSSIVNVVEGWCLEMKQYLPSENDYINVNVVEVL